MQNIDVTKCFRLAVGKMTELSIPPHVQNYTIWYEYFTGRNQQLNSAVEKLINKGNPYTEEGSEGIYRRFFGEGASLKQFEEMQLAVRVLVGTLAKQLEDLLGGMHNFDQVLINCESQLQKDCGVDMLGQLVATLLDETKKARRASQSTSSVVVGLNAEIETMQQAMAELSTESLVDPLTGIGNRRTFDRSLSDMIEKSERVHNQFCLMMLDIDEFKKFNDQHGHLAGDRVLRFIAQMINKGTKGRDIVARYGGEEFAVILPLTDYGGGMVVARDLVEKVGQRNLTSGKEHRSLGRVTLSIGLAVFTIGDDSDSIIGRADRGLYLAKSHGRNRVVGEKDSELEL